MWDGPSVAKAMDGSPAPGSTRSFRDAWDHAARDQSDEGRKETGADSANPVLEPPDARRFADIKQEIGRRSLQRALDISM